MAKRKVKIITFAKYMQAVKIDDRQEKAKQAYKKLYEEHKIIDKFTEKGEVYFIVEG